MFPKSWKDDNPRGKPHYNGDITIDILGLNFSNSMLPGSKPLIYTYGINRNVSFSFPVGFSDLEELGNLYRALNNWNPLVIDVDARTMAEHGVEEEGWYITGSDIRIGCPAGIVTTQWDPGVINLKGKWTL